MKYRGLKRAIVMLLALTMLLTSTGMATFAESLNEDAANPSQDAVTTEQAEEIQDESVPTGSQEEASQAEEAKADAKEEAKEEAKDEASDKAAEEYKLTAKDWEKDLPKDVSKDVREAMAQVAKSQIGDEVDLYKAFANADSIKDGDASFVMFVLEYANVLGVKKVIGDDNNGTVKAGDLEFPVNANIKKWVKELKNADIYKEVENDAMPEQGDIVFTHSIGSNDAAVVLSADEGKFEVAGIETEKKEDKVSKYTVDAEKVDGFVSLKDIAPEKFAEEQAEEPSEETAEETADAEEELTEEELAAKKAEEEAAAAKKAEEEAAARAAEEAKKAAEAAEKRVENEGLVNKKIDAELTSAPGFGGKFRSLFTSDNGTEIALRGYLPEEATVKAYPVKVEIPGQNVLAAYDITIYVKDADGNDVEWQPAKPLNVSIKTDKLAEAAEKADANTAFNVFHMENIDSNPRMVESIDLGNGEASFEADHFSIYIVGEESTAIKVNYRFWWDESDINNTDPLNPTPYRIISVEDNNQLLAPADPIDASRGAFVGWYTKEGGTEAEFDCSAETAHVPAGATENVVKDIYAKFDGAQYADFQSLYIDMHRTVFFTKELTKTGSTYSIDLSEVPTYGAPVGYKFMGWSLTQPTDHLGYGENIPKTGEGRYYKPDETITGLSGNVTLYPVVKKMYTVSFNGNGGTVNDLPVYKIQATNDDVWEDVLSEMEVKRGGHSNDGKWYDAAEEGNEVALTGDVTLTADATYYVHWTPGTTTVTVKYWKEAVDKVNEPYSLIDTDTFTVNVGSSVELGKAQGTGASREHIIFSSPEQEIFTEDAVNAIQTGGQKLSNNQEHYVTDPDLKYFFIDSLSSADPDGNRHNSSPDPVVNPNGRTFTVAEDGSTVINVWINRTEYKLQFHWRLYAKLVPISAFITDHGTFLSPTTDRRIGDSDTYTVRLGESLTGKWPTNSSQYEIDILDMGWMVVAFGDQNSDTEQYPDAVNDDFPYALPTVTGELLDHPKDSTGKINLYARYNSRATGNLKSTKVHNMLKNASGNGYTEDSVSTIWLRTRDGGNNAHMQDSIQSVSRFGYTLNQSETTSRNQANVDTINYNNGVATVKFKVQDEREWEVYHYVNHPTVQLTDVYFYYDPDPYTIDLNYGDKKLASTGKAVSHKAPMGNALSSNSATSAVYADPHASTSVNIPDYMNFTSGDWYTDEEFTTNYKFKPSSTMPASNVVLYAKLTPKNVTVNIDNGKTSATETITDPALNLSGSEMGGNIRKLQYVHNVGSTNPSDPYKAHEHTIAEFLPTYWVNPVWENHVFTGWQIREKDAAGNWGDWHALVDINTAVDHDIELEAHWTDMTRHNIHYMENGKEVYLDPETYVEGSDIVVKGTTTEIYHKETNTTEVFQYWEDSNHEQYKPGQKITMGTEDITLTAVFAEGGTNSGSEKATYTFKVPSSTTPGAWETYYEETVYRAERLSPPPNTPTTQNPNDVFEGWYLDSGLSQRFDGFGIVSAPVDTILYASFTAPKHVTYRTYDAAGDGDLITVQTYASDGSENLNTMGVGQYYTYRTGSTLYALIGWDTVKRTPGTIPAIYWSGYTDHKVTQDMTLYPVLEDGFWLRYHHDEDMATIQDVYYARSQNLNFTWPDPDEVTREGYIFTGKWYTTGDPNQQNASTEFNWNRTLTEDTTIYAGWTPDPNLTSQYTVVWWVEKADSNGDLTDKSNYVYSNSVTKTGVRVGTSIPNTVQVDTSHLNNTAATNVKHADLVYKNGVDNSGFFAVNNGLTDASTTVTRDGKATLNIYVQRVRYTLQFNVRVSNQNRGTITFGGNNYTTNWTETAWFEMPLAGKWPVDTGNGNTVPKLEMRGNYRYGGWDNSNFSNPTTVPDIVAREWLTPYNQGATIPFNLLGDGANTQTVIHYRFLNDVTKDGNVAANYDTTTYDGRSFDQTLNSSGSFGAKDILGYDHHADIGTNPTAASGDNPRTYTFYYTRQAYKIHLHDANGSEITQGSPITLLVGESLAGKIEDPSAYGISTPAGKEFDGWSRSADSMVDVYDPDNADATMPLYDIHYYLHWKNKTVTVTVQKEDGTEQVYGPKVYGTQLSEFGLESEPIDHKRFNGWLKVEGETVTPIDLTDEITANTIVKGDYVSLQAKDLYYDLNGGALKDGQSDPIQGTTLVDGRYKDNDSYMVGATVPVKNIAAKKLDFGNGSLVGYNDFAYWNTERNGSGDTYYPGDAVEIPDGSDMVLYAIYSPDLTTTLKYDLNYEGQPEDQKSVVFRDYRSQEHAAGEYKVNDIYTVGTEYVDGAYTELSYGEGDNAKPVDMMRPGYTFLGWADTADATEKKYDNGTKIRVTSYDDQNHHLEYQTLYAVWEPIQLPIEVYEVTDGYPGEEKPVTGANKPYLVATDIEGITNSAKADSVVAESYDAYTRNAVPTADDFGKAMLSTSTDFDEGDAITFVRVSSETNKWQYTIEANPASDDDWNDFGENEALRLFYYPNPRDVNVYFVAEEEDGTLTEIKTSLVEKIKPTLFTISNSATTGDNALKIEDAITTTNKLYNLKHIAIGPKMTADTGASALTSLDSNEMYLKNKIPGVFYSTATENSDLKDAQALPAATPAVYIVYKEKTTSKLTVTKTATGEYADLTKEFDFTISGLTAGKQYDFTKYAKGTNGQYAQMTGTGATGKVTVDSNGEVTFKLAHDQKIELQMPVNTELTISETQEGGYTAKWSVDAGTQTTADSVNVTLSPTAGKTAECENVFNDGSVVPTGISGHMNMLMLIVLAFALATAEFYILMRRRRVSR